MRGNIQRFVRQWAFPAKYRGWRTPAGFFQRRGCRPLPCCGQKAIHFSINLAANRTLLAGAFFAQISNAQQIA
jgi:hypothetical protein